MRRTPSTGLLLGALLLGATGCGSTEPPPATEAVAPVAKWTPAPELPIFASPDKKKKPIPESKRYRPEKEPTFEQAALGAMPGWCRALASYMEVSQRDKAAREAGSVAALRRHVARTKALAGTPGLPPTMRQGLKVAVRFGNRLVETRGQLTEADLPLAQEVEQVGAALQAEVDRSCTAMVRVTR